MLAWHVKVNNWIKIKVKVKKWIKINLCYIRLNTCDLFSNKHNGIFSIKIMIPIIQTCLIESNPSHKHHSNVILNSYPASQSHEMSFSSTDIEKERRNAFCHTTTLFLLLVYCKEPASLLDLILVHLFCRIKILTRNIV